MADDDLAPVQVMELMADLEKRLPDAEIELDAPFDPAGAWWIDVAHEGRSTTASWQKDVGYGEYEGRAEYGSKPLRLHLSVGDVVEAVARSLASAEEIDAERE